LERVQVIAFFPKSIGGRVRRALIAFAAMAALYSAPAAAQIPPLTADLLKDITEVEEKLVGLANALSLEQYAWRPAPGVRSIQEVLMHVAADNYFIPAAMGVPAPAETKINATDYAAVQAFENQKVSKDATIAALRASFVHLRKAMSGITESRFADTIKVFGQEFTNRQFMILTATHMHEHLGQMIAYARSNNVKPPWSR
jgi:uncharacterized damage-inducible protein DinB